MSCSWKEIRACDLAQVDLLSLSRCTRSRVVVVFPCRQRERGGRGWIPASAGSFLAQRDGLVLAARVVYQRIRLASLLVSASELIADCGKIATDLFFFARSAVAPVWRIARPWREITPAAASALRSSNPESETGTPPGSLLVYFKIRTRLLKSSVQSGVESLVSISFTTAATEGCDSRAALPVTTTQSDLE